MKEIKPATTFDEQILRLQNKKIIIDDPDACRSFLSQVNYYRLSGYYLPYMDREKNKCFRPTSFNRIVGIYHFDAELRSLLLETIETIEIFLRSQFSNYHSLKYGPEGYLDPNAFNSDFNYDSFMEHVEQCKKENAKNHVMLHHNRKYGGHFPLWVIIEFFSIGTLSYFYKGLHNADKAYLAKELFNTNYQSVESWLRCLTDLRNCCAHYTRLYYRVFSALPKIPDTIDYKPTRRLFAQICVLKFLYPEKSQWISSFIDPLTALIEKYKSHILLKHLDFPDNWKDLLF